MWEMSTAFGTFSFTGGVSDAIRNLMNLSSVFGCREICISASGLPKHQVQLVRQWARWYWGNAGGTLQATPPQRRQPTMHPLPSTLKGSGKLLGVNLGGSYVRIVLVEDGLITQSKSVPANVNGWPTLDDIPEGVRGVGIAYQESRAGQVLPAFDVPVTFWADGQAAAAAEAVKPVERPTLVLKLGTSIAAGLATHHGVCVMPFRLARFTALTEPPVPFTDPGTGTTGTLGGLLGAGQMARTFTALRGRPGTFLDLCQAAANNDPAAEKTICLAAHGIAETTTFLNLFWPDLELVMTGKNVEPEPFGECLREAVCRVGVPCKPPSAVVDLCAAIGAIVLMEGQACRD